MSNGEGISIDAHAHFYPGFGIFPFLRNAHHNLSGSVARDQGLRPASVLFVLSTPAGDGFRRLRNAFERDGHDVDRGVGGWQMRATAERASVCLTSRNDSPLVAIAGRQIVSRERLEVLALGTCQQFESGKATETLIRDIAEAGALPVLPWGVGKWLGRRGRLVEELIEDPTLPPFFLGDSAHRPALWPRPSQFRRAEERGIKNLPGSDPLPFPNEARRVGRFGVVLNESLDLETPAQDLKRKLLDPSTSFQQFGRRETPLRFVRNQLKMQLRKLT